MSAPVKVPLREICAERGHQLGWSHQRCARCGSALTDAERKALGATVRKDGK